MFDGYSPVDDQTFSIGGRAVHSGGRQNITARLRIYLDDASLATPQNTFAKKFRRLEKKWKSETEFSSSLAEQFLNENYAAIIGMGTPAIPLILQSLKREPDHWFYALRAITNVNPVTASDAGNVRKMADAWLAWGRKKGFI